MNLYNISNFWIVSKNYTFWRWNSSSEGNIETTLQDVSIALQCIFCHMMTSHVLLKFFDQKDCMGTDKIGIHIIVKVNICHKFIN